MDGEDLKKSKFSSGINIIVRIDELWKDTHRHSRADKFYAWNNDLDCIWRELARDLDEVEEGKDIKDEKDGYNYWQKILDGISSELKKNGKFLDNGKPGFEETTSDDLTKRDKQYELLNKKQLILARLENSLGKGTTEAEEADDSF